MPTAYKVLGQIEPAAQVSTLSTLYTVPSSTSAVVSSIIVCNNGTAIDAVDIAVRVAGAAIEDKHYLYRDLTIPPRSTISTVLGITLATTDVLSIRSTMGTTSFNAFGSEIS
jgi:hypothetical protein